MGSWRASPGVAHAAAVSPAGAEVQGPALPAILYASAAPIVSVEWG